MFVGRAHELSLIRNRLADRSKAQLVILYGRRRIGKSTLIAKALEQEQALFFEGIEGARTRVQISQFLDDLSRQTGKVRLAARSWREVFQGLGELLPSGRWVLVFDEFPWMGAGRTQIVSDLKLHWDRWSRNPNLCLFLCGSVASFMTQHVVHSKAFHNRKTLELCLGPLTPRESGLFIPRRSVREKAQLYMCLGGVPKYLEQIDPRQSLEKNLNHLCFSAGGFFTEEYETLFKEQFRSLKVYETIVAALARAPAGLSELARQVSVPKGGGFGAQVANLIRAQFVREYQPVMLGGKRRSRTRSYKLTDPFLIFFFHYIRPNRAVIERNRRGENLYRAIAGPTIQQYYGYAFERLCEEAMEVMLDRLGLRLADIVEMGPFFQQQRGQRGGVQIDWLIVRRDGVWTLLEFKYGKSPVGMQVVHDVEQKIQRLGVPPEISVEPVLVSAAGATKAVQRSGFFHHVIELEDLV
ncbi:MAG: ATP-binding protein [Candidatus Eisenbacteria sp.]|nr:ATP-binding protein [Candidatus Eisenbacteria bacterium]